MPDVHIFFLYLLDKLKKGKKAKGEKKEKERQKKKCHQRRNRDPEEILKLLPSDPHDQLDVACKITSLALSTRVYELESESSALRARLAEKDALIAGLLSRFASLAAADIDKGSLLKQNRLLTDTVLKLSRYVEKLEFFKKTLVDSLQEEEQSFEEPPHIIAKPTASEDDDTQPPPRSSSVQSELSEMGNPSAGDRETEVPTPSPGVLHGLLSERSSPDLSPLNSPPTLSASVFPSRSSNLVFSRRHAISFANPGSIFDDRSSVHSLSSTHSSLSGMETRSQTGRNLVDGREFLRKVRMRLSYEQFGAFLASVKDFNYRKQNSEDTLRKAAEIFGTENKDLYDIFQGLLTRDGNRNR